MTMPPLVLDGRPLTIDEVEDVARENRSVHLGAEAARVVIAARAPIDALAAGKEPHYGINTGFGSLSRKRIAPDELRQVQRNLIRSHAAGVGEPLPREVVRATMLLLAASLARGLSGVRVELIEQILSLLKNDITPVVPSRGSVGASGDLAPLAHIALVLIGEGEAIIDGRLVSGGEALRARSLQPVTLQAKEGLALINGTHVMAAIGALGLADIARLCDAAIASAAMAIDACRGTDEFLDARIHEARCQIGQQEVAYRIAALLEGSQIIASHKGENDPRVQDPYCLRATPQVLGAAFDTIEHARTIIERELGAVTDNPLVIDEKTSEVRGQRSDGGAQRIEILSGGNFHGMPLAIAFDTLKIAICHIAGIAERRVYWLLAASDSENPVNIYLSPQPGLHSGLMIAQYTAAACCAELQTLATPASVHNIPTSAGIEDYNSMGMTGAHQLRAAVDLATNVIAIELLVMTEAMEYQRPRRRGAGVESVYQIVRRVVPRLTEDRPPAPDITAIARVIREGALVS